MVKVTIPVNSNPEIQLMMKNKTNSQNITVTLASFWRKFFAWIYDLLGAVAVFLLAMIVGRLLIFVVLLPWNIEDMDMGIYLSKNYFWWLYLLASVQYYYVWCWVKGGQTIGMKTWRLKLCKSDGQLLNWKEGYSRSFYSLFGLGMIWGLFNKDNQGIQDWLTNSYVVLLPKNYDKQQS